MTSMRKSAELGSLSGRSRTQPGARSATGRGPSPRRRRRRSPILRVHEHRVRVRAAARLDVRDVLRIRDVGDVEDADAAQPIGAHRVPHALPAAVEPAAEALARDEEQIPVDGDVALRCRAVERLRQLRAGRVRDVPDLEAVVVALDRVVAGEREVGVGAPDELSGRRILRDDLHVPRGLARIVQAGAEPDARIRRGRRNARARRRSGGCARRHRQQTGGERELQQCHGVTPGCVHGVGIPVVRVKSIRCMRSISDV